MKRVVFFVAVAAAALWALGGAALAADTFSLQAEDYKATGAGFGFYDADTGNSGGQYRTNTGEDVDIEVAYDGGVAVGYNVGWTNTDEWFKLTTDPGTWITDPVFAENKRYLVRAHKAGYGGSFRIDIDGVAATAPITYLATGGWQTWNDSYWALTKSPITAGSHEVTFYITGGGFNVDYLEFKSTDIEFAAPIAQKLDPRTGYYYELVGSQTWDQARVNSASLGTFHGVQGVFAVPESRIESEAMGSLGSSWIALTDATGLSDLDAWSPDSLGTDEGGDESGWAYPAKGEEPVYGERGYGWKRLDGKPLLFQRWNSGEPNDAGGAEDAAQLYTNGQWNDNVAGTSLGGPNDDTVLPYLARYATTLNQGKFQIVERKSTDTVNTLADAEALLGLPAGDPGISVDASSEAYAVSFQDPDDGGGNANYVRAPFFTNTAADDEHFALKATAQIEIPTAGEWTFAVMHDDYAKLTVDGNTVTSLSQVDTDLLTINFATAGTKSLELIYQEQGGGAYVQLFAAQGGDLAFDPDIFHLVGDVYGGGLALAGGTTAHAGDANQDGKVDDLDASILAANWQRTGDATWATADFNGDGNVNDLDASILAANWQYGVGSAVPEPGTLVLLAGALAAALLVRRRK